MSTFQNFHAGNFSINSRYLLHEKDAAIPSLSTNDWTKTAVVGGELTFSLDTSISNPAGHWDTASTYCPRHRFSSLLLCYVPLLSPGIPQDDRIYVLSASRLTARSLSSSSSTSSTQDEIVLCLNEKASAYRSTCTDYSLTGDRLSTLYTSTDRPLS